MTTLIWIIVSSSVMAAISLVGAFTLLVEEERLQKWLMPMVALAAGTLLGGALFHLLPMAIEQLGNHTPVYLWVAGGFITFFCFEQFLHWHHCHTVGESHRQPLGYMLLMAGTLHNFVGGLAVGGAFVADISSGIAAWLAAAAHEVPQELGDFGVLVQGGWTPKQALLFNFLSALSFPIGALIAYGAPRAFSVDILVPFAAGNFIYIAAADLVPEVREHEDWTVNVLHLAALLLGVGFLVGLRFVFHG